MPLVKFKELEKQSKFTLLLNEDEKDLFIEKASDRDWKDLFIIEKDFFSERSSTQYYRVFFDEKCIKIYNFITDIFSIGMYSGLKFTLKNYK